MRKMWKFIFTVLIVFVIVAFVKAYFTPDLLGEAVDNILSYDLQANRVTPEDMEATQDGKKGKIEFPVPDSVLTDIRDFTWKSKAPVELAELALVKVPFYGFDGEEHMGEIVVHNELAQEVLDIFRELDEARYPIEKVKRMDAYQGNEEKSVLNNNSTAFYYRPAVILEDIPLHSYGRAVDINPFQNPYVSEGLVSPEDAQEFGDRSRQVKGMIQKGDACYNAFISRGWVWGGDGQEYQDYGHFEKPLG